MVDPDVLRKIVVRRAELNELEEQLAKQLDQVRTEQEELAVAERVLARMAEQFAAAAVAPAEMQVAGRAVLLVPHRGPGMAQDVLPPDYQRILAVVRDTGGPVSTRQVGEELGLRDRVGRNRALEVVLTADLFDAETAAAYGWINRALPADRLDDHVDRVAENIAALPDGVIEAAKRSLPADDFREGLLRENDAWVSTFSLPAAQHLISGGLQNGAQTPAGERDLEALMRSVAAR
ncbi:enoyl-CoA hydratase/isomerase family protein [Kitasatospora sp. NPDC088346]|uniref:enoyl-CoA hydratase/isomerase family protein n=1 Tax=Kitasatospora sp. NPDC088346 TaxID=3364073 RepID=UPI0037FA84CD